MTWDGKRSAQVQISVNYWNRTCGLCGNFDADDSNDFRTPQGELVSVYVELIQVVLPALGSWLLAGSDNVVIDDVASEVSKLEYACSLVLNRI